MRYRDALREVRSIVAYGLREKLKEGYSFNDLRSDVLAGLVVGVVALPLSMALSIACGVAPEHGLYTAIIAGVVCALLGGTRCQVTGPTAAFVPNRLNGSHHAQGTSAGTTFTPSCGTASYTDRLWSEKIA